ncbi:hypothetical protein [Microbispora rosea]|uniref:hypothetical protein n=1 Tax=Microbispora rosea TaxID=58117 RepID=UPI003425395D
MISASYLAVVADPSDESRHKQGRCDDAWTGWFILIGGPVVFFVCLHDLLAGDDFVDVSSGVIGGTAAAYIWWHQLKILWRHLKENRSRDRS